MEKRFWDKGYILDSEREGYEKLDSLSDDYFMDIIRLFHDKEVLDLMEYLSERQQLKSGVSLFNTISEFDFYEYIRYRFGNQVAHERTAYFINDIRERSIK